MGQLGPVHQVDGPGTQGGALLLDGGHLEDVDNVVGEVVGLAGDPISRPDGQRLDHSKYLESKFFG